MVVGGCWWLLVVVSDFWWLLMVYNAYRYNVVNIIVLKMDSFLFCCRFIYSLHKLSP